MCNGSTFSNDIQGVSVESDTDRTIESLYRSERLSLLRLGYLMTGDPELAEDLVQTAFVALQSRWDDVATPIAYLRRVVVNRAKDRQRRSFRAPPPPRAGVTEIPEIDETFTAILDLSEVQRIVVVLRYYEGLDLAEIADLLDRRPSTVRSDLRRALGHLRKALS